MEKIIVVGAGFSGATIARLFAESGKDVIVIDKRDTVGGNAYDYTDSHNIVIQPYGPHFFHTNDKEVFEFLSQFTEWRKHEHKALARVRRDKLVPIPFNLKSLYEVYPADKADALKKLLIDKIGLEKRVPILQLKKHENHEIRKLADYIYKHIFSIYTMKQWGYKPEVLGEDVMAKVPVCITEDDRYYLDTYQFMPTEGYTELVKNILRHPHIQLKLSTDAKRELTLKNGKIYFGGVEFDGKVIYTGCVAELFNYKFGTLAYRSAKFKFETLKQSSYQPVPVVTYTTSNKFTRITEFTKFTCEPQPDVTVILKEYSKNYRRNKNTPFYPIRVKKNLAQYNKYLEESKKYPNLHLLGRIANYKCINMDVAVRNAMNLFNEINDISSVEEIKEQ